MSGRKRTAVVTGGAGYLGSVIAARLADAGHDVWIVDPNRPDVRSDIGWIPAALGMNGSVDAVASKVPKTSILVNVAGVMDRTALGNGSLDRAKPVYDVNLWAAWELAERFAERMRSDGFGRIVNVSSIQSLKGIEGYGAYSSSKAALDAVTRAWAAEFGPHGVTVNAVAAGYLNGTMIEGLYERIATRRSITVDEARRRTIDSIPLGRLVEASEVAEVVEFLVSERASAVNGARIRVDGGASNS